MPRKRLLSPTDRAALLALPTAEDEIIRHYTLSEPELSIIRQHRGDHNRLGFAIQLCYLRHLGCVLPPDEIPPAGILSYVAKQLSIEPELWSQYAQRAETRREHLLELQAWLHLTPFTTKHFRHFVCHLTNLARQTDQGIVLARALLKALRQQGVIVPAINVIERVCSEAHTRGTRQVYEALITPLSHDCQQALDALLEVREDTKGSVLMWLRQAPSAPNAKHILIHIERLKTIRDLGLPNGLERSVHQNRLLKLAREGGQMTAQHLRDLEVNRRYATIVAIALDTQATLIDEIIDLHDRILGSVFNRAKRCHAEQFQEAGRAINDKLRLYSRIGRALLNAKQYGDDPFAAIETILPWERFVKSVNDAEKLTQSEAFDYLPLISNGFTQLRRYTPVMLDMLSFTAAPAARDVLEAVNVIKKMNKRQARKVPEDAPTTFVRKRWASLVHTDDGLDRRFYELAVMSELKNALRSGDIWVHGSRQFRDFEEYLLPPAHFATQRKKDTLGLAVDTDCERFLSSRLTAVEHQLMSTERLAAQDELPNAVITEDGLKVRPLDKAVPKDAEVVMRQAYKLLPRLKITELITEVDRWCGFSRHFTHLKSNEPASDTNILLTAILADAINLGLAKMAESCSGASYAKLTWVQAWHIREETYAEALAELVNAQFRQPLAAWWGDGTTSSSDGQNFKAGGRGHFTAQVNPKYGSEPGVQFYTHISDQYAPFHTKVINATVRDATHVLDGLLYHESDLRIKEHYTDTAGFTDHVFALMHLLGYRFAPRIRGLPDKRLYVPDHTDRYPTLASLIGGRINVKQIRAHWEEILRLAASIQHGTVTASLMLRKLGSYPRQNGLAVALRELGRIERTLFTLDWLQSVELRRRVQIGLNKGEARNALARAVFFNRLGELRDRSFENQRYRASGLNLIVAAIVLWNTVYLERSIRTLENNGKEAKEDLLQHLSPLGWEHISLTGDYVWQRNKQVENGQLRPLRSFIDA